MQEQVQEQVQVQVQEQEQVQVQVQEQEQVQVQVQEQEQEQVQVQVQAKEAVRARGKVKAEAKERVTPSTSRRAPLLEHLQLSRKGTLSLKAANQILLSPGADALLPSKTMCSPFRSNSGRWLRSITKL